MKKNEVFRYFHRTKKVRKTGKWGTHKRNGYVNDTNTNCAPKNLFAKIKGSADGYIPSVIRGRTIMPAKPHNVHTSNYIQGSK